MEITWKLTKKRGNWRPVLKIEIKKEAWETELLVPRVKIKTPWPDVWERKAFVVIDDSRPSKKWAERGFLSLYTPFPSRDSEKIKIFIPLKKKYPEIEIVLRALLRKYERALIEAYDRSPFEKGGRLEMSDACKRHVAPGVAREKILRAVGE
jgi:hypothetical protein